MIKLAYNKTEPNLVFKIDSVIRTAMVGGVVEYYNGTLVDTTTNTETNNYRVQVMGFESDWLLVPTTIADMGEINNQDKTVNPATVTQVITADAGYTGLANVTVNPVTSSIDANIVPDNIKAGVTILGVTGTAEVVTNEMYWDNDPVEVTVGNSNANYLQVLGSDTFKNSISFSSADTSIADVTYSEYKGDSYYITISGVAVGTTYITASSSVTGTSESFEVNVVAAPTPTVKTFPDQTIGDLSFTNASATWQNGSSLFECTITNNTASDVYLVNGNVQVILRDSNQQEVASLPGFIGEKISANGSRTISSYHYMDITSAESVEYDFTIQQPELVWNYPTGEAPFYVTENDVNTINLSALGFDLTDYEMELSVTSGDDNTFTVDNINSVHSYGADIQISGVAMGTANVTATISSLGLSATGTVEVKKETPTEELKFDPMMTEINLYNTTTGSLTLTTNGTLDLQDVYNDLQVTSSDTNVVTVTSVTVDQSDSTRATVTLTAANEGNATITATINSHGLTTSADVKVFNMTPPPYMWFDDSVGEQDEGIGEYTINLADSSTLTATLHAHNYPDGDEEITFADFYDNPNFQLYIKNGDNFVTITNRQLDAVNNTVIVTLDATAVGRTFIYAGYGGRSDLSYINVVDDANTPIG